MAALDIDPAGLRGAGQTVGTAAALLSPALSVDAPPCAADAISVALMANLNSWQRWLVGHIRAGASQAAGAAAGMGDTASAYEIEDAAAAASYVGGGGGSAVAPAAGSGVARRAPVGPVATTALPDISSLDGEVVAGQLEVGAGGGPAMAAAAHWQAIATQVSVAGEHFEVAHAQVLAAGESEAHPGMTAKLVRASSWAQAVSAHARALGSGYGSAASLHASAHAAVGTAAEWRALKLALVDARLSGNLPLATELQNELIQKELDKSSALTGYRTGGDAVDRPSTGLPDPRIEPNDGIQLLGGPRVPLGGPELYESDFSRVERYMYGELTRNVKSPITEEIRKRWSSWSPKERVEALKIFYEAVKEGGPWDHKHLIQDLLHKYTENELFLNVPGTRDSVYYDIWSNIHYGYVGAASGFSEVILQGAQAIPSGSTTDFSDVAAVHMGVSLFEKYGPNMTLAQFDQGVRQLISNMEWAQRNHIAQVPQLRVHN